jgi:hypothetical protein
MACDLASDVIDALERWHSARVAVRVVAANDELIAVFTGRLGARSREKGSSLFWPIESEGAASGTLERPGIYAHPELLTDVRVHVGEFVVEFTQAGVTVNIRRLDSDDP